MDKKAFPVHPEAHGLKDAQCEALSGMDLRDYFAAKAIHYASDRCKEDSLCKANVGTWETLEHRASNAAKLAYLIADAMLKARNL